MPTLFMLQWTILYLIGNGYPFLLLYRLTSNEKYLHRAREFASFMQTKEFKENSRVPDAPYSLFEGIAGTACFLADLTNPAESMFPFVDIFWLSSCRSSRSDWLAVAGHCLAIT